MRKQRSLATVVLVALGMLLASCGSAGTPSDTGNAGGQSGGAQSETGTPAQSETGGDPIPVGIITPVTGAGSNYGAAMAETMKLAAAEVNAAGGPLDRPLKLYYEDGATNPDDAVRAAKKLLDVNKVVAVLGTWSSAVTLAVAPLAVDADAIEMSTSGAPNISDIKDDGLVLRTFANDSVFGSVAAQQAWEQGYRSASVMINNNPATIGIADHFTKEFKSLGGKILATVQYNPGQTSYKSEVRKALDPKPDMVLMSSYTPDAVIIAKEGYAAGAKVAWMGPGFAINQQFVDGAGKSVAEGVLAVDAIPDKDADAYKRLAGLYQQAAGGDVFAVPYAVDTYDQIHLLALAIQKAGTTEGKAVAKAMVEISGPPGEKVSSFQEGVKLLKEGKQIDYEGASSQINFDDKGDVSPNFGVYEVQDGKVVLLKTVTLDE